MRQNLIHIDQNTPLAELAIPCWDVVLTEALLIPPWLLPASIAQDEAWPQQERKPFPFEVVGDLLRRSPLAAEDVIERLRKVQMLSQNIEITCEALHKFLQDPSQRAQIVLLDVRERWEFELVSLAGSLLLADLDFPAFLRQRKSAPLEEELITVCHHGRRSYSAALYLKEQGLSQVRSLQGGLERWAHTIDPGMTRY